MTTDISPRPALAHIDAAIEQAQASIRELMRARRILAELYDLAEIDAAYEAEQRCGVTS